MQGKLFSFSNEQRQLRVSLNACVSYSPIT